MYDTRWKEPELSRSKVVIADFSQCPLRLCCRVVLKTVKNIVSIVWTPTPSDSHAGYPPQCRRRSSVCDTNGVILLKTDHISRADLCLHSCRPQTIPVRQV